MTPFRDSASSLLSRFETPSRASINEVMVCGTNNFGVDDWRLGSRVWSTRPSRQAHPLFSHPLLLHPPRPTSPLSVPQNPRPRPASLVSWGTSDTQEARGSTCGWWRGVMPWPLALFGKPGLTLTSYVFRNSPHFVCRVNLYPAWVARQEGADQTGR